MKILYYILLAGNLIFFTGCSEMFEYSPFDANVDTKNENTNNITNLIQKTVESDTLRFVVISDNHSYYDQLNEAITRINKLSGISFIINCGDLTESGLAWEYNHYNDLAKKFKFPIISAIGNHDYLSNGSTIYQRMFGPTNFSFTYGNCKFVVFDDIVWEHNNQTPDFNWLEKELATDSASNCILITHIPPWTDQLEGNNSERFAEILKKNKVLFCLNGHLHNPEEKKFANIPCYINGSVYMRNFTMVSVSGKHFKFQRIAF